MVSAVPQPLLATGVQEEVLGRAVLHLQVGLLEVRTSPMPTVPPFPTVDLGVENSLLKTYAFDLQLLMFSGWLCPPQKYVNTLLLSALLSCA